MDAALRVADLRGGADPLGALGAALLAGLLSIPLGCSTPSAVSPSMVPLSPSPDAGATDSAATDSAATDSGGVDPGGVDPDRAGIEATLVALYDAFCFDAGGEADWDGMRALFAPGATFFPPIRAGRTPAGQDADEFVASFQSWVRDTPIGESGLHERITHWQISRCGTIAHAFVTFDGIVPGSDDRYSQGVDAIGLVQDGERWLVGSFSSQYARPDAPLPERFVDPARRRQGAPD